MHCENNFQTSVLLVEYLPMNKHEREVYAESIYVQSKVMKVCRFCEITVSIYSTCNMF